MDSLAKDHGHQNARLIMHTDPLDQEGPNLFAVSEMLGIKDSVFFSRERIDFEQMNVLYNLSDFCLNMSYAEGFGLSTLESMMTGTPIVAVKTGGLTRQVVDHRDGSENGVAVDIDLQTLVGSQQVPYIYEDYASNQNVGAAIKKLYDQTRDVEYKKELSQKVLNYARNEFSLQKTVDMWHESMLDAIKQFKERPSWFKQTF